MSLPSFMSPAPTDPMLGVFLKLGSQDLIPTSVERRQEADALRPRKASAGHDLRQSLQVIGYALSRLGQGLANEKDRPLLQAAVSQTNRLAEGLADLVERIGVSRQSR